MSDTKLEIFQLVDGGVEARVTVGKLFVEKMHRQLESEIVERAAAGIAEKFIAEKGTAIIASIDLKDVLNSAVAKVVTRLSEDSRK